MKRITGKIILAFVSLLLLYATYYLFNSSREFSRIYPFKRILIGNTLTFKIDTADSSIKFGSRILKIGEEEANSSNVISLLAGNKADYELDVELETGGYRILKTVVKTGNADYLLFLSLLLVLGFAHYLWGSIVYLFRPYEKRSKLFLFFSIILCVLFYSAVNQFISGKADIIFIIAVLAAGLLNFLLGVNFTNQRIGRIFLTATVIFACIIIVYAIYSNNNPHYSWVFILLFAYYVFCSSYTFTRLVRGIIKKNYIFIKWRFSVLFILLFIGNSCPVLNMLLSCFSDNSLPVFLTSGLTLLAPIIAGNAFLRYTQYDFSGFKILQLKDLGFIAYSFFVTILASVLLYSLLTLPDLGYYRILYIIAVIFMLILLLNSYHFLLRKIKDFAFENKDKYAFSVQKIAELCASSESIEFKLENLYEEILDLSGAASIKPVLFLNSKDEFYSELKNFIDLLTKDSDLYLILNLNKGIILRYALSQDVPLESRIINFLRKRNFVFAIPLTENDELKGALLVGDRRTKRFYSEDDINYFQTVISQIWQVIESDHLYKDYILKKQYEEELDKASYVQLRLFPKTALKKDRGLDLSFFYRPYLRVIGDYFDFFKIDADRTAIVIGDVSGHGLSTAMVLSAVNSITHAILMEKLEFSKTFIEINNFLNKSYRGIELITLFIGIFNRKTKVMEYINAGHGAPLLIKKHEKKVRQIEGRSKILGADPDAKYFPSSINLSSNDELILYTDGVMEIYNEKTGSGINEEKFTKIIVENIDKDVDSKIIEIEKNVKLHSKDIRDDITIIGVRVH